jgi:hypothetical protein
VFTRSGWLWFKPWTAVDLMARLAYLGISPHPAITPQGWNAWVSGGQHCAYPASNSLACDITDYLETFAPNFFQGFSEDARSQYLQEVRTVLEPQLRDADGTWIADYVRLRFAATKAPD